MAILGHLLLIVVAIGSMMHSSAVHGAEKQIIEKKKNKKRKLHLQKNLIRPFVEGIPFLKKQLSRQLVVLIDDSGSYKKKETALTPKIKKLIRCGASVTEQRSYGRTVLHLCALYNYPATLELCLRACDVRYCNIPDNSGDTPVHAAIQGHSLPCLKLLMQHGADFTAKGRRGSTLLHDAAWWYADSKILSFLLTHGADPNSQDWEGNTPLILASQTREFDRIVQELVHHGAYIDIKNNAGCYPVLRLQRHGLKLMSLLEQGDLSPKSNGVPLLGDLCFMQLAKAKKNSENMYKLFWIMTHPDIYTAYPVALMTMSQSMQLFQKFLKHNLGKKMLNNTWARAKFSKNSTMTDSEFMSHIKQLQERFLEQVLCKYVKEKSTYDTTIICHTFSFLKGDSFAVSSISRTRRRFMKTFIRRFVLSCDCLA